MLTTAMAPCTTRTTTQTALAVEVIKHYAGPVQVQRRVMVNVPGKHFPQLQAAEQAADYPGTAVEFKERHQFPLHRKAWGAAHTGPGMRFICESDAIDDPNSKGFWTNAGFMESVVARHLQKSFGRREAVPVECRAEPIELDPTCRPI